MMHWIKQVVCSGLISFSLLLQSHAGTWKDLTSVQVDQKVNLPNEMGYFGATQGGATAAFGLLGAAFSQSSKKEPISKYAKLSQENGIRLDEIFRESFLAELTAQKLFEKVGTNPADGTFELKIEKYSLVQAPTGFERLKPVMTGHALLKDSKGKKLWDGSAAYGNAADEVTGATNAEYWADAKRYRKDWKTVTEVVSKRLLKQLASR